MATARLETFGLDLSGNSKWVGGAVAGNGKLYTAPYDSSYTLQIDFDRNSANLVSAPRSTVPSAKWRGAYTDASGNVRCIPYDDERILLVRYDGRVSLYSPYTFIGNRKFSGGAVAKTGYIYGMPFDSPSILEIDTTGYARRVAVSGGLTGTAKWHGGVGAPNGLVYGIPYNAPDILIIDAANGAIYPRDVTRSTLGADLSGSAKWMGGVLGADGKIYGIPYNAPDILVIDPDAGTATRTTMGADLGGSQKWAEAVAAPDGKIYAIPFNAPDILVIDVFRGVAYRDSMGLDLSGTGKWWGGVLGPDNQIYGIPYNATSVLIISDFEDSVVPGIYLRDPLENDYYSLPEGEVAKQMAFGPVGVGTATAPRPVVVENQVGKAVEYVLIEPEDSLPEGVYVEVSFTEDPFVPESLPLLLEGPFASGQPIVTLWVRVRSETSAPLDRYVVGLKVSAPEVE